jgi:hypothetical protein
MVIERTHYYAKPDRAAEVLRTRRRASAVRERLGLPVGRIAFKADPATDGPDVAWECAFPDAGAQARDLAARATSAEFEAVRATMGGLIVRFERQVLTSDSGDPVDAARPAAPALVPTEARFRGGAHDLTGYLYAPEGTGPVPALVLNHGPSGRPSSPRWA